METKFIVRVHHPDITEEERQRRMKQIRKAAEGVLKEKEKGERNGKIQTDCG